MDREKKLGDGKQAAEGPLQTTILQVQKGLKTSLKGNASFQIPSDPNCGGTPGPCAPEGEEFPQGTDKASFQGLLLASQEVQVS